MRTLTWAVTDQSRRIVSELPVYEKCTIELRWLDKSAWSITCPIDSAPAAELAGIGYGVAVDLDGTRILAGPVTRWVTEQGADGEETIVISGVDWMGAILESRTVWPLPTGTISTTAISRLNANTYNVPTGPAETVIKNFVTAANTRLPVAGLVIAASQGRGSSLSGASRFHSLAEVVYPLAKLGGIGLKVDLSSTGTLTFDATTPVNRSAYIQLSREMQNVLSATYSQDAPVFTRCVVAGAGEAALRDLVLVIDLNLEGASWPPLEGFVDARDVDAGQLALLQQRGLEFLSENNMQLAVSCEAEDTPQMTFGVHYNLGDQVLALGIVEQVSAVTIEDSSMDGVVIMPSVGSHGADDGALVRHEFARFRHSLASLERR